MTSAVDWAVKPQHKQNKSYKIYRQLLDCMHCRFMREDVLSNLNMSAQGTEKQYFIKNSLDIKNVKIAELTPESSRKTSKYSAWKVELFQL